MKTTAVAVLAALLSFLIGNAWVFISADMFVRYFYEARMVALTHVFTLGWVSLMIVGVLRQLAPLAFGLKLERRGLIGLGIALWIPGLAAMVAGFATLIYGVAAAGTSLVFVAAIIINVVLLQGFLGIRRDPAHHHMLAALLYFAGAALLGTWMGLSKGLDFPLPASFHRVLFAHIHLAGAGWAGMMILAVMSCLFPQPLLRHPIQARIRFAGFNVGLIGLTGGLLLGSDWYGVFGSLLAVACVWYAIAFIPIVLEFGQQSDRSTAFLVSSWTCLAAVAVISLWFSIVATAATPFCDKAPIRLWIRLHVRMAEFHDPGHVVSNHSNPCFEIPLRAGNRGGGGMRRTFIDPALQI